MAVTDADQERVVGLLLRDLDATIGTAHDHLVLENAVRLREFVDEPNQYIERVVEALYADISLTVHPGRSGHLLGFHPLAKDRRGIMTSFSMDFSDHLFRTKMAILVVLTAWFRDDARTLVGSDGGRAITLGQVMVRVGKNRDDA